MKLRVTVLSLFFTIWAFSQTTVQFSEPHQFLDTSDGFLNVKILVNNIEEYNTNKPIIVQLFSDLEDISILGITATQGMDKVIFLKDYTNGEEIRLPVNPEALKNRRSFSLFLRKKEEDEHFTIFQNTHSVIVNKSTTNKSYIGISAVSENSLKTDLIKNKKIEIPILIKTEGYLPVQTDNVIVKIKIKGIEESDSLNTFKLTGAESVHKILVEKRKNPEVYKKIIKELNTRKKLELEISDLKHQSQHQIELDKSKKSVSLDLKKANSFDAIYSFYLGTNFNLESRLEVTSIYSEINVSLPELFKRWGINAGIYKNNNSKSLEEFRTQEKVYEIDQIYPSSIHEVSYVKYTTKAVSTIPNVSIENIGVKFIPTYKVIESNHFKAFVTAHIELVERREKYTYTTIDEFILEEVDEPLNDFLSSIPYKTTLAELVLGGTKNRTEKYYDKYGGLGFDMRYSNPNKGFEVSLYPIFGVGEPGLMPNFNTKMKFFGAFQFNIIISAKESLAFMLGSDARQYFGVEQKPTISINISTKLDLSKLIDLAGG